MKKFALLLLAALVIGCGASNAQNKFKKSNIGNGKAKTEQKAEVKATDKANVKTETKATEKAKAAEKTTSFKKDDQKKSSEVKKNAATEKTATTTKAPAQKKKATVKHETAPVAKPDISNIDGFYTNTYSDGIGGTCTHRLTVNFDPETNTVTGLHTNESGVARTYHGKVNGDRVICYYDEDGDEFAEMKLYDANTIKLEGFTGTFKRNDSNIPTVSSSPSGYSGATPVDRSNYEAIQKYLKEKEQEGN